MMAKAATVGLYDVLSTQALQGLPSPGHAGGATMERAGLPAGQDVVLDQ